VRAYRAILSARFRTLLQYRAAAAAGFGTQLFWGLIRVMIFEAFYRSTEAAQPMSLPEVVTYVWLGQAMLGMLPWNTDRDVHALVRSGNVAYELLRPLDLYWHWYARALAWRVAPTMLRAAPMFVVAGIFLGLGPPASWASLGAWLVSMLGALLLSCAITTLLNISLMWTIAGEGMATLMTTLVTILSGMIVPLPFFPEWAQSAINFLPFRGLVDVPFRLYMGHLPPGDIAVLFAGQLAWTLAFVAAGRLLLGRGTRRLVVQGG
jgi:ABC-2 type transport system permease protein